MSIKVKICGVTRPEDAAAAAQVGADAIGLNFASESPRYLKNVDAAKPLVAAVAGSATQCAGVFVNPALDDVLRAAEELQLQIVQLHGEESPQFVAQLRKRLAADTAVWKAFRIATAADLNPISTFVCDGIVIDAKVPGQRGGSGHNVDWALLRGFKPAAPVVLSGGLRPENVRAAIQAVQPAWVDVASGVESAPGVKDAALIAAFVREARA